MLKIFINGGKFTIKYIIALNKQVSFNSHIKSNSDNKWRLACTINYRYFEFNHIDS